MTVCFSYKNSNRLYNFNFFFVKREVQSNSNFHQKMDKIEARVLLCHFMMSLSRTCEI